MSGAGIFGLGVFGIFVVIAGFLFYFLPSIVAFSRGHKSRWAIFLLDFFLGWSFIGWIIALVWSFSSTQENVVIINNHHNDSKSE